MVKLKQNVLYQISNISSLGPGRCPGLGPGLGPGLDHGLGLRFRSGGIQKNLEGSQGSRKGP